jgi:hypothetical protein
LIDNYRVDPIYSNPGDFNRDGVVDAAGYVIWRKGAGETFTTYDYDQWRSNLGKTYNAATVVEPQTLLCFCVALTLVAAVNRTRK